MVIIKSKDGSHTLFVPELNEHYHSTFGAIQESNFIFIESGFHQLTQSNPYPCEAPLRILEIGFGTGLNALLTQIEAEKLGQRVFYTAIEAFPLSPEIWSALNYPHQFCSLDYSPVFHHLHTADWNKAEIISSHFTLHKIHCRFEDFLPESNFFSLIYFDAFGPDVQPELWTAEIFQRIFNSLIPGGVLVTYSVKGDVIRALKSVGFQTEKLPGPPGKRHILRATKK